MNSFSPAPALATLLVLVLTACATSNSSADRAADTGVALQKAAETPFADLNLVQEKIPPVLQAAVKAPYSLPSKPACPEIAEGVHTLDAALGADLDTPPTVSNPGLVERGSNTVSDATNDALRGAGESVIPFRGWVRKLDGAERHSKDVAAAIAAGAVRRAFLKGVGQALGCDPPAAPRAAALALSVR